MVYLARFKSLDQIGNPKVRASAERELAKRVKISVVTGSNTPLVVPTVGLGDSAKDFIESSSTDASRKLPGASDESAHYVFGLSPVSKPRMTQRDKWLKPARKCVAEYWKFKDELVLAADKQGFVMPESHYHLVFYLGIPKSWTANKKAAYEGEPHRQKPDKDNLEKAVLDALLKDDSKVWDGRVSKFWSENPRIEVYLSQ